MRRPTLPRADQTCLAIQMDSAYPSRKAKQMHDRHMDHMDRSPHPGNLDSLLPHRTEPQLGSGGPDSASTEPHRPLAPWAAQFVSVNGARLFTERYGHGAPVVLIHGDLLDRRMWDPQVPALAQHYEVIRYDLRNYGQSKRTVGPYEDPADLRGLLDIFQIERAALVGASLGGAIALDVAVNDPSRVGALVLLSSGLPGHEQLAPGTLEHYARYVDVVVRGRIDEFIALMMEDPSLFPESTGARGRAETREHIRSILEENAHQFDVKRRGAPRALGLDRSVRARLQTIQAPTLILVGERDVPNILDIADELAQRIAHARQMRLAGGSRYLNLGQPGMISQIMLAFLQENYG